MRNIHVLSTDKPSRLAYVGANGLCIGKDYPNTSYCKPQNIYITSDEEIKERDYFIAYSVTSDKKPFIMCASEYKERKKNKGKIILTTDQDLIKDGVQAIDDEFLEWFVKNPSCEFVDFEYGDDGNGYQIIIPKEAQKQHLINMMQDDKELGLYDYGWCKGNIVLPKEYPGEHDETQVKKVLQLAKELSPEDIFNDEKRESVKRVINQHKVLKGLSLINPLHLQMTESGYGEFPDSYKLTEKGIQYIIEKLNKE